MKALVQYEYAPGKIEIRDIPEPQVGPGLVKVKVIRAGLCGSEQHQYKAAIAMKIKTPVVMGHEFAGIIEEVGEGVTRFKPGQRVVAENGFHVCGVCDFCREGYYNVCIERQVLGYWHNGTFAEKVLVPEKNLLLLPDNLSFDEGASIEPLACVCHMCFDLTPIKPNDVVLVTGPGPIGLLATQVAKTFGATVITTGVDCDKNRLARAKELGADYVVNTDQEEIRPLVDSLTNNYGVDVVLECSGSHQAVNLGLDLIKKRGHFTQFGLTGKSLEFNMEVLHFKEVNLVGCMGSRNYSWRKAVSLAASGKVNVKGVLNDTILSLEDFEKAIELAASNQAFKAIFDPSLTGPVMK